MTTCSRRCNLAYLIAILLLVNYCGLFSVLAQQSKAFSFPASYSCKITGTKDGTTIVNRIFVSDEGVRSEILERGENEVFIICPIKKAFYRVDVDKKKTFRLPYDPEKFSQLLDVTLSPQGKIEPAGKDSADGMQCSKFKVTDDKGKVSWWWIDDSTKVPVKKVAVDGLVLTWTDFRIALQDAHLFQPPSNFQLIDTIMPLSGGLNVAEPKK